MNKTISLHIGCGEKFIPEFTYHVDIRKLPHVDFVTSADKLGMFDDNSVNLIYVCHLLDHFDRNTYEGALKEWYRVLKSGGILRLAVSDFEAVVRIYLKTHDLESLLGLIVGGQTYPENKHGIVFDFAFLSRELTKVGFKNIRRYDWRETIHKNYDDFSRAYMPKISEVAPEDYEKGTLVSLNIEAVK